MVLENLNMYMQKNELCQDLSLCIKVNSKSNKDLNLRSETLNMLKKYEDKTYQVLSIDKRFLNDKDSPST